MSISDLIDIPKLYTAYRKAKVDVFFERSQAMCMRFCEFEDDLEENLEKLHRELTKDGADWFQRPDFIGSHGYLPKGLSFPESSCGSRSIHFSPSDPDEAWATVSRAYEGQIDATFRPIVDFTVSMSVVCALWINLVGNKYDACLDDNAKGSRLRRISSKRENTGERREYHEMATGSFGPYYYAYREWRQGGLDAIRRELESGRRVVAMTMDLNSFYHKVDPAFLTNEGFIDAIGYAKLHGASPSPDETAFTTQLVEAFTTWSRAIESQNGGPIGLPVGTPATHVMANMVLAPFDRCIKERLTPIYYGRYVDDLFLVFRDPGNLRSADDVIEHITARVKCLEQTADGLRITGFDYLEGSELVFGRKKQRIFPLSGEVGRDLIDTIKSKIDDVSSEWRLLPDLELLERGETAAARALTATQNACEDADSLRKADTLSLRRLGFALLLRHYSAVARDLPPSEWVKERKAFYRFAMRHAMSPQRLLELDIYIPKLISMAVSSGDWSDVTDLIERVATVTDQLQADVRATQEEWNGHRKRVTSNIVEAILGSLCITRGRLPGEQHYVAANRALKGLSDQSPGMPPTVADAISAAERLTLADLGDSPLKEVLLRLPGEAFAPSQMVAGFPLLDLERYGTLMHFVGAASLPEWSLRGLQLPTRPLSPPEITELCVECVFRPDLWARYARAIRGVAIPIPNAEMPDRDLVAVGFGEDKTPRRIALTSFLVEDTSWSKAAYGTPDLSNARYRRLVMLANDIIRAEHRPHYAVFPELSIPREWIRSFAQHFMRSGVSLIAGEEYRLEGKNHIVNDARLFLRDNRLGFGSWCAITQCKTFPSHGERDSLRSTFDRVFPPPNETNKWKPVFNHFGFCFRLLICSELTNSVFRQASRGAVDALFVLCWNRDLDSFASLVESSALDVHAYVVLVNNRKYGDSRLRAPYRDDFRRDTVRVKGGLDDYFVVAEIDTALLRNFQSHHEPPREPFKPTPDGFILAPYRRCTPLGGPS